MPFCAECQHAPSPRRLEPCASCYFVKDHPRKPNFKVRTSSQRCTTFDAAVDATQRGRSDTRGYNA